MSSSLPSAAIDDDTVVPVVAGGEPVMAVVYAHRLSPWRAACWYGAALLFSVAFVVLYFVLGDVTRVEVSFLVSPVHTRLRCLVSVFCEHKCETDLFNITVIGEYDGNGNYPELGAMIAAASPFKMNWCQVYPSGVHCGATSQQTPPLFNNLFSIVSCGDDNDDDCVMYFLGTFRASSKWYAMIGGPRLYGESAFVRDLFDIAINIAVLIVLVAFLVRVGCLQIILTASQETVVDIRLARASLRCASIGTTVLDVACLFFVALQHRFCNFRLTVYEGLHPNPDTTIAPEYYACLGAMAVCVALSFLCTEIGYTKFSSP